MQMVFQLSDAQIKSHLSHAILVWGKNRLEGKRLPHNVDLETEMTKLNQKKVPELPITIAYFNLQNKFDQD